ncbi:MAG: TonB-dependent receptor [Proteobacteria bacterium]|nr:TonB-dependent receptor [Pseudomonadota bacterium]
MTEMIVTGRRARLDNGLHSAIAAAVLAALLPTSGHAQSAPVAADQAAGTGTLREIIVTAERRKSNLQTTPVAVTAIDSQAIGDLAPRTLQDIAQLVPNFSVNKINGFNAASFAMRGVGNTDIIVYNSPPVAVLIDDFVMPSVQTQLLDPFDVQSIQVLRGPQGTLFGANTIGGAVVVQTKAPKLNETSFDFQGQTGSYNTMITQGALNVPLIKDKLALRLVASRDREQGWMRNGASDTIGGVTYKGDGRRVGGTDVTTLRASVLWQPSDALRTQFMYEQLDDNSPTPAAVNLTPASMTPGTSTPYFVFAQLGLAGNVTGNPLNDAGVTPRSGYLINSQDGQHVKAQGYHLNTEIRLEPGTITWVQGYRTQNSSLASNYTGVVGPLSVFDANRSDLRKTWQEEVRFTSRQIGRLNYVAGLFYYHDHDAFCVAQILGIYDLFGVPTPPGAQPGGYNNNPQVLCNAQTEESSAVYGQANWKFTPKTTLTIGARLSRDTKNWIGRQQVFVQQLPSPTGAFDPGFTWQQLGNVMNAANFAAYPFGVVTDSHTWTQPTYNITLSHKFSPEMFVYGTFAHGFQAGGYNDQVGTSGNPITPDERKPTNPEKADSFEVGMKSEFFQQRVRLNEAAFYVKYKDVIRQVVVPVTNLNGRPGEETLFRNAAQMTVYGLESELTARLTDNLLLHLPLSYQHCKYDSFTSGVGNTTVDLAGLSVNRCPQWTATVDLNYAVPMRSELGSLDLDASANYVSKNLDTYSLALPYAPFTQTYAQARTLLDATVTYTTPDDRIFVRFIGRNLMDKVYLQSAQNVDPLWIWGFYGEPRYLGVQAGYRFRHD